MSPPLRSRVPTLALLLLTSLPLRVFAADSTPPPAEARAVENLAVFARTYGYIRFFYPGDEASAVDWDRVAMLGAEAVRDTPDDDSLREALRAFFRPLAPAAHFLAGAENASSGEPEPATPSSVTFWQYQGVRLSDESNLYRSRRVLPSGPASRTTLFEPSPTLPSFLERTLAPHLRLRWPRTLPLSEDGKTPRGDPDAFRALETRIASLDLKTLSAEDWRLRVAGVVVAWNVFQHFHPYLDCAGIKWDEALRPALRRALSDRTRDDYYATLSSLVAKLEDGHGYVFGRDGPVGGLPIRVERLENQLVVTAVADPAPFRKGDILVRIDGTPALDLLRERERYVSGSPHLREHRALNQFGEGPLDSVARIELLRDGRAEQIEFTRSRDRRGFFFNPIVEFEHPTFAELRPGIFYVNLSSCDLATLTEKLPQLAAARGVIFDWRPNGQRGPADREHYIAPHKHIIPHLIDAAVHASPMLVPQVMLPDREGWTYRESTWPVAPQAPRFTGRVVFINVPSVVSYGETCMAIIAHHKLATLVGEPTAGCNGNVNFIPLPAGLRIMWTGMEVLKHDRSQFYGTGFTPDHPVVRTLASVKENRDEFLEKALAVIEEPSKKS